jgi:hypothetical protein
MSFFRFSAILYVIFYLIERLWPLLLVLLIYFLVRKQVREFRKHWDGE